MHIDIQFLYVFSLFIWLLFFLAGKFQYSRLRNATMNLALEQADTLLRRDRDLTVEHCYEVLLPEWERMLKRTTWFIPHKTEMWPMPARPDYVRNRMNLSPVWLGAFLELNGFKLLAAPALKVQIDEIVKRASITKLNRGVSS